MSRRADRLFRLVRQLQIHGRRTASDLAAAEEVSVRTVYRDLEALSASGVPVQGTPGEGYRLSPGWKMPALRFDIEEIEALMLGLSISAAWGDAELARSARAARDRILEALPQALARGARGLALHVPDFHIEPATRRWLGPLRRALRERRGLCLDYADAEGRCSSRRVDPLGLFFWGDRWTLVAWCHLRGDFRHFRVDRIATLESGEGQPEWPPGRRLEDYLQRVRDC
ncbi:helix-turn-helix transcriptional regulator [Pseudomarimonas salicorniae]|uniref:YafY family transcriptional regulator n=1 Tax=Pseudomarimonas salicorniae TaxID=2933270 RepID=A0ABT0GEC9_9GAMM|nr:YafY family protein [Lysobacter sp. CAU 1642]MCK7592901.1 YafY family transcriptional regulator [Lysobacter sp. CAU 1642]